MNSRPLSPRQIVAALIARLLQRINVGDLTIRNHWTGDALRVHSFKHRSYWYHGKRREMDVLMRLPALVKPGDLVVDVGAHIGYVTQILSRLVASTGQVIAFEPGANNLPYLTKNTRELANVRLLPTAVCDRSGDVTFYLEDLSGQNNSLLPSYQTFKNNCARLGAKCATMQQVRVPCTTLDIALSDAATTPSFVKIDVEGAEMQVLRGMSRLLERDRTAIMIEVTVDAQQVFDLLIRHRFRLFAPCGREISRADRLQGNVFGIKAADPRLSTFVGSHALV